MGSSHLAEIYPSTFRAPHARLTCSPLSAICACEESSRIVKTGTATDLVPRAASATRSARLAYRDRYGKRSRIIPMLLAQVAAHAIWRKPWARPCFVDQLVRRQWLARDELFDDGQRCARRRRSCADCS